MNGEMRWVWVVEMDSSGPQRPAPCPRGIGGPVQPVLILRRCLRTPSSSYRTPMNQHLTFHRASISGQAEHLPRSIIHLRLEFHRSSHAPNDVAYKCTCRPCVSVVLDLRAAKDAPITPIPPATMSFGPSPKVGVLRFMMKYPAAPNAHDPICVTPFISPHNR